MYLTNMNSVTEKVVNSDDKKTMDDTFDHLTKSISVLSSSMKTILSDVKNLQKSYNKLKLKTKKSKSSASSQKNDEMNNTPLEVKDTLIKFLSLKPGSKVSRKESRDGVTKYIKTNNLQDKDRMFKLDSKLKTVFNTKESPQYYIHIKKLLEHQFITQ